MERAAGESGRVVLESFLTATERGDAAAMMELADDDLIIEWPQSGERFRGRDNAFAAMEAAEVKPEIAGEPRIVGSGDVWVVMMPLRYGSEVHQYAGVFELENGRIRRTTEYFGAPCP